MIGVIITGATGMVGEGVMHECLLHPDVEKVLVINRKPGGVTHPKVTEIIHTDFYDLSAIESKLSGYNACVFCLGVSSVGLKEADYHRVTYDLTMHVAKTLLKCNSDMTFCYISGTGTDSSEKGRAMWARVKGKTENHLMQLGFKNVYMFRPGFIEPTPGLKNTLKLYRYLGWLAPVLRLLFPGSVSTLKELALAIIRVIDQGYSKQILEVRDIVALARHR